ncbi:DNA-binding response regulator [candidate division KSB1 bacterium 4484_87]|nr:MAG: DNA-binding response regulator [candidate division KSB1 bacterium 4484_87]
MVCEKEKILVIEDEPVITEFLRTGLTYEGYDVTLTENGHSGLSALQQEIFKLLILDIMLPDIDGFEVCRRIRDRGLDIPILMLTAKKDIADRVKGLDTGADDYMTKPFSFDELLARIRALLRRSGAVSYHNKLTAADIILDTESHEVTKSANSIDLTPTEFAILELFMRHPRRVFTRETLLNRVLGYNYVGEANIIDVHISHLRDKLDDRPPRLIQTVYGVGYSFHPEAKE